MSGARLEQLPDDVLDWPADRLVVVAHPDNETKARVAAVRNGCDYVLTNYAPRGPVYLMRPGALNPAVVV